VSPQFDTTVGGLNLPKIVEEPDLIQCEYAKGKRWPSTFRRGSEICLRCDRLSCTFHPRGDLTQIFQPDWKPLVKHETKPAIIGREQGYHASPALERSFVVKPKLKEFTPGNLTSEDVLEAFPSPKLRAYQKEIVTQIVEMFVSGHRCVILAAPTGFGKSYVNAAFASLVPSFYATPQLALIDQIMRDPYLRDRFVEIRGRRNYRCYYQPNRPVHVGKCVTTDFPCRDRDTICPYWIQKVAAKDSRSILTSLSYLIAEGQTDGSESYLGSRSLLVLDEAHNLEEQCLSHISLRVSPFTLPINVFNEKLPELLKIKTDSEVDSFLESVEASLKTIAERSDRILESTGLTTVQAEDIDKIQRYLTSYQLYKRSKSTWVWQIRKDELLLQPIFGREYLRDLVWKRGQYYIVSSATIMEPHEYAELTGLSDYLKDDEISFLTVPSTFPPENRPIIDATIGRLSAQELSVNMPKAIRAVEDILRKEPGNVAIHCHSYRHQQNLLDGISEEFKPRLIAHTGRDREEKLQEWMQSRGKVFVSVAFNEGQDWKYDVCDAQILLKVPFPDLGDKRIARRLDMGYRDWYDNQAMLEVVQAYGRAIRAEDDKARFYIIDSSFNRLLNNRWNETPEWFREALPQSFRNR